MIQNIFNHLNINGKLWFLELNSVFESAYARLRIFEYIFSPKKSINIKKNKLTN